MGIAHPQLDAVGDSFLRCESASRLDERRAEVDSDGSSPELWPLRRGAGVDAGAAAKVEKAPDLRQVHAVQVGGAHLDEARLAGAHLQTRDNRLHHSRVLVV